MIKSLLTFGVFFYQAPLLASAIQFYELGTPIIGTAGVGQAALAMDASTAYFNPAGMGFLNRSQFQVGTALIVPNVHFDVSTLNTFEGNGGGPLGTLAPNSGIYFATCFGPNLRVGLALTSPYGGYLNYNNGWVGRYRVEFTQIYTVNLNPSLAYRINDWISIGAGIAGEYANLRETIALPLPPPLEDGQIDIKADNYTYGYNLGVLFQLNPRTRVGVAYRSKMNHHLHGKLTFLRIPFTPGTTTKFIMPQNVIVSGMFAVTDQLTFLGEAGWSNWATMKNTIVNVAGFTATTPRDWDNTYRLGIGAQYQVNPCLMLQAGASYDSSPTKAIRRLPDLPMDRQLRLGTGLVFNLMHGAQIGLSYEYLDFGRGRIRDVTPIGTLAGSYPTNFANIVQASINVEC